MTDTAEGTPASTVESTREELRETLDAIEDKLNVPKQVGRLRDTVQDSIEHNRLPWLIGAGVAVAVIGGLVAWALLTDD